MAVEDGDVVMVPRGYHPVGAPHGYDLYYLNVMAGPKRIGSSTTTRPRVAAEAGSRVNRQRVLVVGLGTMGLSHARAYKAIDGFDLVGFVTRNAAGRHDLDTGIPRPPALRRPDEALQSLKPDAVAVCAYTEHHAPMALEALAAGAHVFIEKPLAATAVDALRAGCRVARRTGRKLGLARRLYPSRHHPSWVRFVELGWFPAHRWYCR